MNSLYLLFYAVILLLVLTIISVIFKLAIGTILSFFWFAFVVLVLLNIGIISRTLAPILSELSSRPLTLENLGIAAKAIYDVTLNQLAANKKSPPPTEVANTPVSTDTEPTDEVDATINEVLAGIDKQEQTAPSRPSNKANNPQNLASNRPRYVEISDLLKDLIGQKDSINQQLFRSGEKVYICIRCQSGYHEDSWQSLGCTCKQCGNATKVREYTLPR